MADPAAPAAPSGEPPAPRVRLSRRGVLVLCLLGALIAGSLGWLVFVSSALDVRSVAVQGLDSGRLSQDEVARALGGLRHGPLARVDLAEAQRRVQSVPRVAKAEVWRGWPHTLRVKVTERRAVASVRTDDGRFAQVDAGGFTFATEAAAPAGVPVVDLQLGQQANDALAVFDRQALVQAAITVAAGLPPEVAKQAGAVQVHSYDDVRLQLAGGVTVRWGSPERTPRKAVVLTALLGRKAANYDVSAPDAPAVSG
ncbi:cell division protein FtsQ/DivIB [Kitasatospora paranensis]|uniref:Cell division protein FtsQ n=1 Tax=Kitasatospora paranensis TaxID=258053 RepID=A0ABW2G0E9_9ACTN